MLVDEIAIEYHGRTFRIPVLLVGSARPKVGDRTLADALDEAMDGRRPRVMLDGEMAATFYAAARGISVSLDRQNLDWQRLLGELQQERTREPSLLTRSRILAAQKH